MEEFSLTLKIECAIKNNEYIKLLEECEKRLIHFLSEYTSDCVFALINSAIIFHNYNIDNKTSDYAKYQRDKHCSLKLLLALPEYYYRNIAKCGNKKISDYGLAVDQLIGFLVELELIYYYYPCRHYPKFEMDEETLFYLNYFKSYYLDYPYIEMDEFKNFFDENIDLCKAVLEDENFERTLSAARILQEYETHLYDSNWIDKIYYKVRNNIDFEERDIWILFPVNVVKHIFKKEKLDYEFFCDKYINNFNDERKAEFTKMMDVICSDGIKIAIKNDKNICFPRNCFWIHSWYSKVWKSFQISENTRIGKTYKSEKHERDTKEILEKYFGKANVFANLFLRRKKGQFSEKDFIVVVNDYVVSIEAKSKILPEPIFNVEDGILEMKKICDETVRKAVQQGNEIREAIASKTAFLYDTNKKNGKLKLNLNEFSEKKFIQIALMYEGYLNIETNIEHIYKDNINFWMTDLKTLDIILEDTVGKGHPEEFIDYIMHRLNAYSLINVQSGEELKTYRTYKNLPFFFQEGSKDIGIHVDI